MQEVVPYLVGLRHTHKESKSLNQLNTLNPVSFFRKHPFSRSPCFPTESSVRVWSPLGQTWSYCVRGLKGRNLILVPFQVREVRVLSVHWFYACFGMVLCYDGLLDVVSAWKNAKTLCGCKSLVMRARTVENSGIFV